MELILTQDVDSLGRAGEVVRVKPGYGRNFLIPRGMAVTASRGNKAQIEHHQRAIARDQEQIQADFRTVAESLKDVTVSVARKAGEGGRLFGSVGSKDVVEALAAQGITLDRRLVQLAEPVRTTGTHDVVVKFNADITATLKVNVVGI